ncbi:MAG: hypothetical protein QNJ46_14760 [Leptolyngbyaceae cyanobacterium MO_188.B28]|nr:hypothetical protein [Leptolyngbyaceae cyanobacterium MO_188.B28]
MGILLTLLLIGGVYYFTLYPNQKIKRIKRNVVLEVDGAESRYPDLPLGNLGIFCEVNGQRRIRVVFPKLTPEGGVLYIYSWHDLRCIRIPGLENTHQGRVNLKTAQELTFLIKQHIQIVEPEILHLKQQERKISEMLDLVATSQFYSEERGTYNSALLQIKTLLKKAEELQQLYIQCIREVLIGNQVLGYAPKLLSVDEFSIDSQYQRIQDEYQMMKDKAMAYAELLQEPLFFQIKES